MRKSIKTLVFSLIAVFVIIGIVGGGTYAYFQWTIGEDQRTNVNVTIEHGGITMHIEPEQTEFVGLYPTANCTTNSRYGDALVTIENNTGTLAIPSFKLKVKVTGGGSGTLTQAALSHIRYTVVPIPTVVDSNGNVIKNYGNLIYNCNFPAIVSDGGGSGNPLSSFAMFNQNSDDSNPDVYTSGSFEGIQAPVIMIGAWAHLPYCYDKTISSTNTAVVIDGKDCGYLPRQYTQGQNGGNSSTSGITFKAEPYSTSYQYFRVYVWIDEGYTSTIVGNEVTDPLQNAKIEITWSENSVVQQVAA